MHLKMSSAKWRLFGLGLNELTPGFNVVGGNDPKTRRESFKFWDMVRLILELLRHFILWSYHVQKYGKNAGFIIVS